MQFPDKEKPERATPASKLKAKIAEKQRGSIESIKRKSADKKKTTPQPKSQFQLPSPPPGGITPSSDDGQRYVSYITDQLILNSDPFIQSMGVDCSHSPVHA